jgi:hypothetical protein
MRYPIVPDDDSELSIGNLNRDLEGFLKNDKIYIEYSPKNKYFLFQLGMILAYNHYTEAAKLTTKDYRLTCPIEPTPSKSHGNVILDFIKNGTQQLPKYERHSKKVFIISSVRDADEASINRGRQEKKKFLDKGYISAHFPYDDTPQEDSIGTRIVRDNLSAEGNAAIEALIFSPNSTGSIVDVGSYYMFKHLLDSSMGYHYSSTCRKLQSLNDIGDSSYELFIKELVDDAS